MFSGDFTDPNRTPTTRAVVDTAAPPVSRRPHTGATVKEVAESTMDILLIELVDYFIRENQNEAPEVVMNKLETLGFSVGQRLAERATKDRPLFGEILEIIKFICKDFWTDCFRKQVDNLRTNHRGVYVLQDSRFKWLARIYPDRPGAKETGIYYVSFPCGLIRGVLANLGVNATVNGEILQMPACAFTVHIKSK